MVEIGMHILEDTNKSMDFRELFNKIAELKGISETDKDEYLSQFYTDLNIDGRFMTKGSNLWGLKKWYPVEELDEDISLAPKKKKKKKVKKKDKADALIDEDLDESELEDDFSDEPISLDELAEEEFELDADELEDDIEELDEFDDEDEEEDDEFEIEDEEEEEEE
nr:DNA-directed RNA polymerase subunit delta [Gracilibacillus halotolerans]